MGTRFPLFRKECSPLAHTLLVETSRDAATEPAAILMGLGHTVDTVWIWPDAVRHLNARAPDVLVVPPMIGGYLGTELVDRSFELYPDRVMGVIFIAPMGATGEPLRNWSMRADNFVPRTETPWTIVLAVEQLLNRR